MNKEKKKKSFEPRQDNDSLYSAKSWRGVAKIDEKWDQVQNYIIFEFKKIPFFIHALI